MKRSDVTSKIAPEVTARVRLYTTDEGGRTGPIRGKVGTPMKIDGKDDEYNDCWMILPDGREAHPGETLIVTIAFSRPKLVAPWVKIGMTFRLWEGKFVAEGEILEVRGEWD